MTLPRRRRNAGPFDSHLDCLLRPKAGATDSDSSLRMTLLFELLRFAEGMPGCSRFGLLPFPWLLFGDVPAVPVAEKDFGAAFIEDDLAAGADFALLGELTDVVF